MSERPGHVKVEMSFWDVRTAKVTDGNPGDQRVRVGGSGITGNLLVEKHPYRKGLYRPAKERQEPSPTVTTYGGSGSSSTIEIPWWLDAIFTIVGLIVLVAEITVMTLQSTYRSIPQKTADRVLLIYGWFGACSILAFIWLRKAQRMELASPGDAYGLGLLAIVGAALLFIWVWRLCVASYPFDPVERPADHHPTGKATAGLIGFGMLLLLVIVGPTAVRAPMSRNYNSYSTASSGNQTSEQTTNPSVPSQGQTQAGSYAESPQQPQAESQGPNIEQSPTPTNPESTPTTPMVSLPFVKGLTSNTAITKLRGLGLSPYPSGREEWSDTVPTGSVISTSPAASSGPVRQGTSIQLTLSKGPQPKCQSCQAKFDSTAALASHQSQPMYACSENPKDCSFTATSAAGVINHYLSQPQQDPFNRVADPNCRSKAFVIGGEKWRVKSIPAPTCANLKKPETWKLEKVRG